jgi:hypothetical protein
MPSRLLIGSFGHPLKAAHGHRLEGYRTTHVGRWSHRTDDAELGLWADPADEGDCAVVGKRTAITSPESTGTGGWNCEGPQGRVRSKAPTNPGKNRIGEWCNGSTTGSEPVSLGSNPSSPVSFSSIKTDGFCASAIRLPRRENRLVLPQEPFRDGATAVVG